MKRGDVVLVAAQGDYGKPRPALVIQADQFLPFTSVTLLLISSDLQNTPIFRVTIDPSPGNGLRAISQVQVDKVITHPSTKVGRVIGSLESDTMTRVTRALAGWLGIT